MFFLLWGFLLVDVLYLYGLLGNRPAVIAVISTFIISVGVAVGPIYALRLNRLWHAIGARKESSSDDPIHPYHGFRHINLICFACGWQRTIGYSGCHDKTRAMIYIKPAKSPCNVLSAVILEAPSDISIHDLMVKYPFFRDIAYDIHKTTWKMAFRPYHDILKTKPCPRCQRTGRIRVNNCCYVLETSTNRLAKHRSWQVIHHTRNPQQSN